MTARVRRRWPAPARAAAAIGVAAVVSGMPSTVHAVAIGRDPLAAAKAAGTVLPGGRAGLGRGIAAHAAVSTFWGVVLLRLVPRRGRVLVGALAGLGIATVDLAIARRRFPAVAALPLGPQVADHVAFGAIVSAMTHR